jgi:hypothetical protein
MGLLAAAGARLTCALPPDPAFLSMMKIPFLLCRHCRPGIPGDGTFPNTALCNNGKLYLTITQYISNH